MVVTIELVEAEELIIDKGETPDKTNKRHIIHIVCNGLLAQQKLK